MGSHINKRDRHVLDHLTPVALVLADVQLPVAGSYVTQAQLLRSCQVGAVHARPIHLA